MPLNIWDESKHSIHVQNFDNDHKQLFLTLNLLYNKMSAGEGASIISGILKELKDWGNSHFKAEEELMERFSYPELTSHKQEHVFFIAKVDRFSERYNAGDKQLSVESFFFLRDWFSNHILEVDKKYADFFHAKGIN
jgi:hemerythrin